MLWGLHPIFEESAMRPALPVTATAFLLLSLTTGFAQQDQNPSFNAQTRGDGFIQNDHANTISGTGINIVADCEEFTAEPCNGNVTVQQRFNSISGALIGAGSFSRSGSGRVE
jgi:hypothetical protein